MFLVLRVGWFRLAEARSEIFNTLAALKSWNLYYHRNVLLLSLHMNEKFSQAFAFKRLTDGENTEAL